MDRREIILKKCKADCILWKEVAARKVAFFKEKKIIK